MKIPSGLYRDHPSMNALMAAVSYWGKTTANGAATGLTMVDTQLTNEPSYLNLAVKILSGPAAGQVNSPNAFLPGGGFGFAIPFQTSAGVAIQITAGTLYCVISTGGGGGPGPIGPDFDIIASGTFTAQDFANSEYQDTTRTEADDYYTGCILMMTNGAQAFLPRLISAYRLVGAGGNPTFVIDYADPFLAAPGLSNYVVIRLHQELEYTNDAVYFDNAFVGIAATTWGETLWPVGTPEYPANTTAAALAVIAATGIKTLHAEGAITLTAVSDIVFDGPACALTIAAGAAVSLDKLNAFSATNTTGSLTVFGPSEIGFGINSGVGGDVTFNGGLNCHGGFDNTGGDGFYAIGDVFVGGTLTGGGDITVYGNVRAGVFVGGAGPVAIYGVLTCPNVTRGAGAMTYQSVEDAVYYDGTAATNGDGSPENPTNNVTFAEYLLNTIGRRKLVLRGNADYVSTAALTYKTIVGETATGSVFNASALNHNENTFIGVNVNGNFGLAVTNVFKNCRIDTVVAGGRFEECSITALGITAGEIIQAVFYGAADVFDLTNINGDIRLIDVSGEINLANLAAAETVYIWAEAGAVINIAASCTAGAIIIYGQDVKIIDASGGTAVTHPVAPTDSTLNTTSHEVVGSKSDTAPSRIGNFNNTLIASDDFSSIRYLKSLMEQVGIGFRPQIQSVDGFQYDGAPSGALWDRTDPATGTAWTIGTSGLYRRCYVAPNLNEVAALRGRAAWPGIGGVGASSVWRRLILEFSIRFTNVANLDNTLCVFGLASSQAATRATNSLAAFALTGDALQTVTDVGGVEAVNTGFGETLTNINKLAIEVDTDLVRFYLSGALMAQANPHLPPQVPLYPVFYFDTEAGGAATVELLTGIRIMTEDTEG